MGGGLRLGGGKGLEVIVLQWERDKRAKDEVATIRWFYRKDDWGIMGEGVGVWGNPGTVTYDRGVYHFPKTQWRGGLEEGS